MTSGGTRMTENRQVSSPVSVGTGTGQPHQRQRLEAVPSDALVVFLGMVGRERDQVPPRVAVELRPELPRQRRVHGGSEHLEIALAEDGALVAGAAGGGRHAGLGAGHVRHERRQGEAQFLEPAGGGFEVRDEEPHVVQIHLMPLGTRPLAGITAPCNQDFATASVNRSNWSGARVAGLKISSSVPSSWCSAMALRMASGVERLARARRASRRARSPP